MRIMLTGGCGFVGHHFVEHFLKNTDHSILVLDALTYAGATRRLRDIDAWDDSRVSFFSSNFNYDLRSQVKDMGSVDLIIHMGAETHVDNSIVSPWPFVMANVMGTMWILELAKTFGCPLYYFSTDEVFGPAPEGVSYREEDQHNPGNPYAATKSGGEMLVKAYANSYGLDCVITRSMNIFGERQHPEKFIPLCIKRALDGEILYIHANRDKTRAGSRFYIHARNVASGYQFLLDRDTREGEYHITGEKEVDNLSLAKLIGDIVGRDINYQMVDFHSSRPGHDLRYALSGEKMASIGWTPPRTFETSIEKTVRWYLDNPQWLEHAPDRDTVQAATKAA